MTSDASTPAPVGARWTTRPQTRVGPDATRRNGRESATTIRQRRHDTVEAHP